jgi:hypothetical protein
MKKRITLSAAAALLLASMTASVYAGIIPIVPAPEEPPPAAAPSPTPTPEPQPAEPQQQSMIDWLFDWLSGN